MSTAKIAVSLLRSSMGSPAAPISKKGQRKSLFFEVEACHEIGKSCVRRKFGFDPKPGGG
jgi:hypothetical protein